MVKNIFVNNNNELEFATDNLALAHNLLQQISLFLGEDKFYAKTGIDWNTIVSFGLDAFPYLNGAISYAKLTQFITKIDIIKPFEFFQLTISTAPNSTVLTKNIQV